MPTNVVKSGKITVEQHISMGHRLPSYQGICASPHGHNVRVAVDIALGKSFIDFKIASDRLKAVIEPMDHAMVLLETDPLAQVLDSMGFRYVLLNVEPTTENLAQYVFNEMRMHGYAVMSVTVYETEKYSATAFAQSETPHDVKRVG